MRIAFLPINTSEKAARAVSPSISECFTPAFTVLRPARPGCAAVFNSPHSGRIYPESFCAQVQLDAVLLRRSEDCYIDELFAGVAALGCPLLAARFPRVFLDVNREPYELDPAMFDAPLPHFVNTTSLRVAGGLGTIPRIVSENEAIYRRLLTWSDAQDRIERVYRPYHRALADLIDETARQFGHAVLIDCHSMPSSAAKLSSARGLPRADIVIGDRYGASCDPAVSQMLEGLFHNFGLSVVHNKPYAGGFITQSYGRPQRGIGALQIEINRALYMNERTLEKTAGFAELRRILSEVLYLFLPSLSDLLTPLPVAAE